MISSRVSRIIIILFVTSFLSNNLLWAGEGQLDNLIDKNTKVALHSEYVSIDVDNTVLHHVKDVHHDGHDCHMSAHLIGLHLPDMIIPSVHLNDFTFVFDSSFTTRQSPPPNKPPRA